MISVCSSLFCSSDLQLFLQPFAVFLRKALSITLLLWMETVSKCLYLCFSCPWCIQAVSPFLRAFFEGGAGLLLEVPCSGHRFGKKPSALPCPVCLGATEEPGLA